MRTEARPRTRPDHADQAPLTPTEFARLEHIARSIWPEHPAASSPAGTSIAAWRRDRAYRDHLRQVTRWTGVTAGFWLVASGLLLAASTRVFDGGQPRLAVIGIVGAVVTVGGVVAWLTCMRILVDAVNELKGGDPDLTQE